MFNVELQTDSRTICVGFGEQAGYHVALRGKMQPTAEEERDSPQKSWVNDLLSYLMHPP